MEHQAKVVILEVTVPADVPATGVMAACNVGIREKFLLTGLEFNTRVLGDYKLPPFTKEQV